MADNIDDDEQDILRELPAEEAVPATAPLSSSDAKVKEAPYTPPFEEETDEDEEAPMTLLDHLGELRRRLTRIVIVVLVGFFACYGISETIYSFISAPLTAVLPEGSKLIYTAPQGAFFTYMKVALLSSIFATSPYGFYQIWAFIAPGLYKEEKRAILPLAMLSAFFFLSGATFCYYMVFPLAFEFFMGFTTDLIVPMISVEEYLSFALKLLLAFGFVFEMPLFAFFLSKLGIITPAAMRKHRKYAVLAIFIVAAILTPPDVFSQCLMAGPMLLLYEVSVYVAIWARKKPKGKKQEENGQSAVQDAPKNADARGKTAPDAESGPQKSTAEEKTDLSAKPKTDTAKTPEESL